MQWYCLQSPQQHLLESLFPQAGKKQTHTQTQSTIWVGSMTIALGMPQELNFAVVEFFFSTYTLLTVNCESLMLYRRCRVAKYVFEHSHLFHWVEEMSSHWKQFKWAQCLCNFFLLSISSTQSIQCNIPQELKLTITYFSHYFHNYFSID